MDKYFRFFQFDFNKMELTGNEYNLGPLSKASNGRLTKPKKGAQLVTGLSKSTAREDF